MTIVRGERRERGRWVRFEKATAGGVNPPDRAEFAKFYAISKVF
jgi:hypothetical protein